MNILGHQKEPSEGKPWQDADISCEGSTVILCAAQGCLHSAVFIEGRAAARFVALAIAKQTGRVPAGAGWLCPLLCVYRCKSREVFEQAAGEPCEPQKGTRDPVYSVYMMRQSPGFFRFLVGV